MRNIFLLTATILFTLLAAAQTQSSSFDQKMIDQEKQLLEANDQHNAATLERAIAEDFLGIGANGDFYGRDEILESAQGARIRQTQTYDFHVIQLSDDSAVVTYNIILPGQNPRYRHLSDTWARIGGQWKLKFRQMTANLWSANDQD